MYWEAIGSCGWEHVISIHCFHEEEVDSCWFGALSFDTIWRCLMHLHHTSIRDQKVRVRSRQGVTLVKGGRRPSRGRPLRSSADAVWPLPEEDKKTLKQVDTWSKNIKEIRRISKIQRYEICRNIILWNINIYPESEPLSLFSLSVVQSKVVWKGKKLRWRKSVAKESVWCRALVVLLHTTVHNGEHSRSLLLVFQCERCFWQTNLE